MDVLMINGLSTMEEKARSKPQTTALLLKFSIGFELKIQKLIWKISATSRVFIFDFIKYLRNIEKFAELIETLEKKRINASQDF